MSNEPTQPKPTFGKPFEVGNPGRPKGSRNRLSEAFLSAMHDDFKEHGAAAIAEVRETDPASYLRVIASVVPKQVEIKEGAFDDVSDEQLAALVAAARSALNVAEGSGAGVGDAEGAQPAEGVPAVH